MPLRSGKRTVAEALFAPSEPSASRKAPGNFFGGIPDEYMADMPDVRQGEVASSTKSSSSSLRTNLARVASRKAAESAEVVAEAVVDAEGASAQNFERLPCTHTLTFTIPFLSTTGGPSYNPIGPLQNPEKHAREKVKESAAAKYKTVLPRFARFCEEYNYDPVDAVAPDGTVR